jgi:predicted nucleic acid-binding protein
VRRRPETTVEAPTTVVTEIAKRKKCLRLFLMQNETIRTAFTFDEHFNQFGFATAP